jgi:hypothetical protein
MALNVLSASSMPTYSLSWNASAQCIEFTWNGFVKGADFHDGCNAMVKELSARKASRLIVDSRKYTVVDPADQLWSIQDWLPRALAAGLKHFAVVMPESVVGKMSVQNVINDKKHTPKDLELQREMFNSPEDARAWIASTTRKAA